MALDEIAYSSINRDRYTM